ncbi:4'-phosphopantetheinyl transferase family protein [Niastella vici]|nr:4'-phosphopantetheinyl transferase superfamily protein [Niastella vici]
MSSSLWEHYFSFLPESEQIKNKRYLRWQDKHAHLFGKILLQNALIKYGFSNNILNNLRFNDHNKPFIDDNINFNISHSGKYIVCAISREIKLGVDLEQKISQVNPDDFKAVFSQAEWEFLKNMEGKMDLFYKLWTRKESVIKANGIGLTIPLFKVDVLSESVMVEGQTWFISDLDLDSNYSASLATSCKDCPISFTPVNFYT